MSSVKQPSVAIIGAGIAGTTTAYSLAKNGMDVTLIDSRRYPAMATSYANGGQLSASNSEVWNTPKNLINGCANITGGGLPDNIKRAVSYTHLTLPTNREV